ncbi:hypothetical protein SEUCBS140593_001528 [Sporothrix eucalyptigena]|uniref:Integral membrane protein n=1 Tax=Sporothrix eucalyptigena TaxID=1812306 RepID=A0ABP0AYY9_9PEZI
MAQTTPNGIFEPQPGSEIEAAPPAEKQDLPIAQFSTERAVDRPMSETPSGCLTFVKRKGRYRPETQTKLRNSLLAGMGFLELANAGDFAANVWNKIPIPVYAIVLMVLGASVALGILYFVVKDARLSWENLRGLRAERYYLQKEKARHRQDTEMTRTLESLLDVNFREMGTELVDRIGMDTFMGFGALTVGIGTFMAIGGANENVYRASNLLSGYIGNAPCALYGLANLFWSIFVWRRAHRHSQAGTTRLTGSRMEQMLKIRTSRVKVHSSLNGITGIVGGAGSLVSATMWWGYVVLIPCIASSILANYFWRHKIGYQRPLVRQVVPFNEESIVAELAFVDLSRQRWSQPRSDPFTGLVSKTESVSCVMEFIVRNRLFEEFCMRLLADAEVCAALFDTSRDTVTISSESLGAVNDDAVRGRLIEIARALMTEAAPNCFRDQENSLLEVLGCVLCHPGDDNEKMVAQPAKNPATAEDSVASSTLDGLAEPCDSGDTLERVVETDTSESST